MNVAIIGLGNIGSTVARHLVAGGQSVIVADRTAAKADQLASELGAGATAMDVSAAMAKAEILVLAIYFEAIKALVTENRAALAGKIVVDPSNPIAPDGQGGFKKTIPAEQSSGEIVAGLLPEGAELVKAFGSLGVASLSSGANRQPEKATLFYATDFPEAARVVAALIAASGFSAVNVGGLDQSIRIEVGGDLHEFGKLGKLVSAREAEALI